MTVLAAAPPPKLQFFVPGTQTPLSGGLLFTYAAGTTTKQTTYSNADNSTPNTNPIVLDANGQCVCFLDDSLQYAFTLAPSNDTDPPTNPYWTVDKIGYSALTGSFASLASPAFTGIPTAPTAAAGTNTTQIATTAFVQADLAGYAPLASPALTGTPTAPTAAAGTNTTQLATTAFVEAAIGGSGIGKSAVSFTSSGNWTVPTGVTHAKIRIWGGGGGGGSATSAGAAGGGGGGGGYCENILTLTPGGAVTVTIGAGGTGSAGSQNGTAGGTTSVSGTGIVSGACSATGGGGGVYVTTQTNGPGGAGGSGSGGFLNVTGQTGGTGFQITNVGFGPSGGGSFGSSPSGIQDGGGMGNGTVGNFPGGGGGGGGSAGGLSAGGTGAGGLVVIEWGA